MADIFILFVMQFVNKLRYAKEGARDIMDRACADLPWQVWLEVDGKDIEIPQVSYSNETSLAGFFRVTFLNAVPFYSLLIWKPQPLLTKHIFR